MKTFNGLNTLSLVFCVGFLLSCAPSKDIELKNPPAKDSPGQPPAPKPGEGGPTNPADPLPGEPDPAPPAEVRNLIFCDKGAGGGSALVVMYDDMTSAEFPRYISLIEPNENLRPPYSRFDQNLTDAADVVPVRMQDRFQGEVLLRARPFTSRSTTALSLYRVKFDILEQLGVAEKIADPPSLSPDFDSVLKANGLQLRTYGISDQGTYVMVGESNQMVVRSLNNTRQKAIRLNLDPRRTVSPELNESSGLLTVQVWSNGKLGLRAFQLDLKNNTVKSEIGVPAVGSSAHWQFLLSTEASAGRLSTFWVMSLPMKSNVYDPPGSTFTIQQWVPNQGLRGAAQRISFPTTARVFPEMALVTSGGPIPHLIFAVEDVDRPRSGRANIRLAEVRRLDLATGVVVEQYPYIRSAQDQLLKQAPLTHFGIHAIRSRGEKFWIEFDTGSPFITRWTDGSFSPMSQESCSDPAWVRGEL